MTASMRAELLRLGRWPVTWLVVGLWLTLNVTFGYLFDYLNYREAVDDGNTRLAGALLAQLTPEGVPATMVTGLPMFGSALVIILAALATGSGYGWSTWKTVFTQGPRRTAVLGGTLLALAVVLVALVALTFAVDLAASAVVTSLASTDLTWPELTSLAKGLGGALLIVSTWAAAGAFVGILTRGPALAVGLGLVWAVVVENLLRGVAGLLGPLESVTNVLPGTAAGSLAVAIGAPGEAEPGGAPGALSVLTGAESVTVLCAYLVTFTVLACLLMARRDA